MNKSVTIVLIEDDASFSRAVDAGLAKYSEYTFSSASTLSEALRLLSDINSGHGPVGTVVVLLDLNLPDSNGLSTFTKLKEHCAGVPIIILSGRDDEKLALQAIELGAQDYLVKGDITSRDLARSITYAMERSKLLADREDFVATLTHDLKGPLFGANRILTLVVDGKFGPIHDNQKELLSKLQLSNVRLLEMIANLLEVYRFEKNPGSLELSKVRLLEIARACVDDLVPLADEKSIELTLDADPACSFLVNAEAFSISRVIRNLLDNAIKYTPRHGKVSLRMINVNGTVTVEISDTGPGVTEADQPFLFRRFFRGTSGLRYSRSTGLGLYLCKQIMQIHAGSVSYHSNQNGGSIFTLEIPSAETKKQDTTDN
ncbi:hybrid sensor histidine kinase/response regulator [Candidatus Obscuribacterales bacterium]|nr:hybrid sensor histidine kinase/response regulator [Candidatus Obscuribacterales bacterium]MBX3153523.1 hybrid sensor histidine kinase/response regulator [Candidatus Obscuribacterales bacterium]